MASGSSNRDQHVDGDEHPKVGHEQHAEQNERLGHVPDKHRPLGADAVGEYTGWNRHKQRGSTAGTDGNFILTGKGRLIGVVAERMGGLLATVVGQL